MPRTSLFRLKLFTVRSSNEKPLERVNNGIYEAWALHKLFGSAIFQHRLYPHRLAGLVVAQEYGLPVGSEFAMNGHLAFFVFYKNDVDCFLG